MQLVELTGETIFSVENCIQGDLDMLKKCRQIVVEAYLRVFEYTV